MDVRVLLRNAISIKGGVVGADVRCVDHKPAHTRPRPGRSLPWHRVLGFALILLVVVVVIATAATVLSSNAASGDDVTEQAIRIAVTLLIPAVVMIIYWVIVQRQVRTAKSDLQMRFASGQDLIARVSRQLRDQLTVIYGFSESLLDSDMSDETEVRDAVTIINTEAVDLSRTVDDLVSAAELEAGKFDVSINGFDPSDEVERVVLPFRRHGHEISVECWSGTAFSDPIRFRQIVRTLLSNAVEHGGPTIGIVGERSNGSFLCTIVDDGDGMSSEIEGRYFSAPADELAPVSEVEGSGLGLTVSHAIAHQLGGYLTYQRTTDLTMVTTVLPAQDWPVEASAPDTAGSAEEPEEEAAEDDVEPDMDNVDGDAEPPSETDDDPSDADVLISFDKKDDDDEQTEEADDTPEEQDRDEEDAERGGEKSENAVKAPASS
jgi:signal transduction histidine kinase